MPATDFLEAHDLACVRGGRTVFEHVNFRVPSGGLVSLEGPNGSGKTSLLRILAGLLPEAAGAITAECQGRNAADRDERGRLCALLGHQDGIKAQLTVAENARFFAQLHRTHVGVESALERVGLARVKEAPAQFLSAGQRRRLALARLLLSARTIWLLDEPFAALDSAGRALAAELIGEHCGCGGIAIAATHEPLGIDAPCVALGTA